MSGLGAFSMWDLFRGEVESQMKVFTECLLALEGGDPPAEHLASAMRAAHSIKGAARIVQLDAGVRLSHVMEDCLVAAQESGLVLDGSGIDVLLSAGDVLSRLSVVEESAVPQWLEEHADALEQLIDRLIQVRAGTWRPPAVPSRPVPESPPPAPVADAPATSLGAVSAAMDPAKLSAELPQPSAPPAAVPARSRVSAALLFEVAGQRYGLDVSQVVEVVPAVRLRPLPGVPAYVRGLCRYRGSLLPVLDLSQMLGGPPSPQRYSTRLVLVRHQGPVGPPQVLGLLAERATHGVTESLGDLTSSGIATPETPYLGKLATEGGKTVQLVTMDQLIPDALRGRLFAEL